MSDVEHFFMYFLAIYISSLEKSVCGSSAHFLNEFFGFFLFFFFFSDIGLYELLVYFGN